MCDYRYPCNTICPRRRSRRTHALIFLLEETKPTSLTIYDQSQPVNFKLACQQATHPPGSQRQTNLLPGGSVVKWVTYVAMDGHAISSGTCDIRLLDGTGACFSAPPGPEMRYTSHISMEYEPPGGWPGTMANYAVKPNGQLDQRYDVDTRQAGTTLYGTIRQILITPGAHKFRWQSVIHKTACNIEPGVSQLKSADVSVASCKPVWNLVAGVGGGPPRVPHLPLGPIQVFVPMAGLHAAVDLALADWNAQLPGLNATRSLTPCSGAMCVNVVEEAMPVPPPPPPGQQQKPTPCALSVPGAPDPNGVTQSPGKIAIPPEWVSRDASRNRRTMAHEFGHLLGLGDFLSSCPTGQSLMAPLPAGPDPCTNAIAGLSLGPTPSDAAMTRYGTYGTGRGKVCGF